MDAELMREKMDAYRSTAIDALRDCQESQDAMIELVFQALEGKFTFDTLEMKLEALVDHKAEHLASDPWEAA